MPPEPPHEEAWLTLVKSIPPFLEALDTAMDTSIEKVMMMYAGHWTVIISLLWYHDFIIKLFISAVPLIESWITTLCTKNSYFAIT